MWFQKDKEQRQIMAKLNELVGLVNEVNAKLDKSKDEILAKITTLEAALVDVELPADAVAALDTLKASAQTLDDIVPDAV